MILGLTGPNAAGKGEVARILVAGGFEYFSLSDEIRAEMARAGVEETRESLIEWGRKIRREHGNDFLARKVVQRFTQGLNQVVDSIRHPAEVEFLKAQRGFFLVLVDAPVELRFARARERGRHGDTLDLEQFLAAEAMELDGKGPSDQRLRETFALADFVIINDKDLEYLREQVIAVFREAARKIPRLDWDEYFMKIAEVVALRSSCVKRQVAAVVVKDRRIISTGYNGTPRGTRNCSEGGCERCLSLQPSGSNLHECICSHAEENAIVQAAYHGVVLRGATLYTTFSPCLICAKMIINAGLAEVVYRSEYAMPDVVEQLLREAGVRLRPFKKGLLHE